MICNFESLCNGFCELADLQPPTLMPGGDGAVVAVSHLRDVRVTMAHLDGDGGGITCLIVELGEMSEGVAIAGWLALLNANGALLGDDMPRFSRDPRDGKAVMQWALRPDGVSANDLYHRVCFMVDAALQWRSSLFLDGHGTALAALAPGPAKPAVGAESERKFEAFYQSLRGAMGQAPEQLAHDELGYAVQIRIGEVGMIMGHLPHHRPGVALIGVRLDKVSQETSPHYLAAVLEANFSMITQSHSPVFCRDPLLGGLMLQYAQTLDAAGVQDCLARMAGIAAIAQEWQAARRDADADAITHARQRVLDTQAANFA